MAETENSSFILVKDSAGNEKKIMVDEDGFLLDPKDWCPEFVQAVAKQEATTYISATRS